MVTWIDSRGYEPRESSHTTSEPTTGQEDIMRECMWRIDTDDVDRERPGMTKDERWNGFGVVYVTEETLTTFATDNGGEVMVTEEGLIIRWPDLDADDDLFERNNAGLFSLMGWCVEIAHTHTFRADIKDMWCKECDTVTDFCTQTNPV